VVLGSQRVGKSTFIQKALDLRDYGPTACSSKKMSLDGVVYIVRLFEVLIDDITINDSKQVAWPKLSNKQKLPDIDGVLMLYDVTNVESVLEIPDVLRKSGSTRASIPLRAALLIILQCNTQHPAASHHRR
jgi:hypothetical protein